MAQIRMSPTWMHRQSDQRWCGIKPLRTPSEVAEILGITCDEVLCIERKIFRKIRQALPPARNRDEAKWALEVAHALFL